MATMRDVRGVSCPVQCDRLDVQLADVRMPRLIKVDVEGAELKALQGMEGLLAPRDAPDVLCEVTASFLKQMGCGVEQLYDWMTGFGYDPYLIKGRGLTRLRRGNVQLNDQENVFFTKRSSLR